MVGVAFGQRQCHRIAIGSAGQPLVIAGEFLRAGVDGLARHFLRCGVDGPAFELARLAVRPIIAPREHAVVGDDIDDDFAVRIDERIGRVEQIAGLDIAPDDAVRRGIAPQHADAGAVFGVPLIGEAVTGDQLAHAERHRQVEHQHMLGRDRTIMDARAVLHRDRLLADDMALRVQHRVPDGVHHIAAIADRVPLARRRAPVRVRGVAVGQRAIELAVGNGVERAAHLHRMPARFDDRPGPPRDADDIGVRRIVALVPRAGRDRLTQRRARLAAAHPAVAVPGGFATLDGDAMHHARASEPVVARRIGRARRVRPVAQIAPVELGGDGSGDAEFIQRHFLRHRGVDAGQVRMRVGRVEPLAVESGERCEAAADHRADRGFDFTRCFRGHSACSSTRICLHHQHAKQC